MDQYKEAAKLLDEFYYTNKEYVESKKIFSDEKTAQLFSKFQNEYSPRWLKNVKKNDVLEYVFTDEVDSYIEHESMIYILINESRDNPYSYFGHVAHKGFKNTFLPFYLRDRLWRYGTGMSKKGEKVSPSEAAEDAFKFKNALAELLIDTTESNFRTIDDYISFSKKLQAKLNYKPQSWLHKYLHMLYPNAFSDFHSKSYKSNTLGVFKIEPIEDDQIILGGQIAEIFRNMTTPGFYTKACTLYCVSGYMTFAASDERLPKEEYDKIYENILNKKVNDSIQPVSKKVEINKRKQTDNLNVLEIHKIEEDEIEDFKYNMENSFSDYDISKYTPQPQKAPKPEEVNGIKKYPRSDKNRDFALKKAEFKCEYNKNHPTFNRGSNGLPYTEAHHLIPMSQQENFENSLDCPANIVSLCPLCHRCIHFGEEKEKITMLHNLYIERIDELKKSGIEISEKMLKKMYI